MDQDGQWVTDIQQDLKIKKNWLVTDTVSRQLEYFCHTKSPIGVEISIMESVVYGGKKEVKEKHNDQDNC